MDSHPLEIRVCIDVSDLERGIAFYTQGLGLRLGRRLDKDWAELLGATSPIDLLASPEGSAPLGQAQPQRHGQPQKGYGQCGQTTDASQ